VAGPVGEAPPRRYGARTVITQPNLIRAINGLRTKIDSGLRIRREEIAMVTADPAKGEPCQTPTMTSVFVSRVYRSGHAIYADVAAYTGAGSVVAARISVPELGLDGPTAISDEGGGEQDLRLRLTLPDTWGMGESRRVVVQACRLSGSDPTTLRVLRAWQR